MFPEEHISEPTPPPPRPFMPGLRVLVALVSATNGKNATQSLRKTRIDVCHQQMLTLLVAVIFTKYITLNSFIYTFLIRTCPNTCFLVNSPQSLFNMVIIIMSTLQLLQ